MSRRETADEIEAAAAGWVWRLDREGRTPALGAELEAWLEGDTRRRGAWLQAEAAWAVLDRASQLAAAVPKTPPVRKHRAFWMAGAAALAACLIAAIGLITLQPGERIETRTGEIRRIPLEDGSTAAINTQTVIEVAMKPAVRVVKMGRGEAWFQVAPSPERPFIVEAGRVRVRAVGTAFSVRNRERGADVTVTEGVVEAWVERAEGHKVKLAAGSWAFVGDDAAITQAAVPPAEIDRKLAWRAGKIDLAGETLAEAVAEFNRYNDRKVVIADQKLSQERFYGVFRTDDPIGFAAAIRQSLGTSISTEGSGEIRIGP